MSNRGIWLTFSTSFNLGVPARKTGKRLVAPVNRISQPFILSKNQDKDFK